MQRDPESTEKSETNTQPHTEVAYNKNTCKHKEDPDEECASPDQTQPVGGDLSHSEGKQARPVFGVSVPNGGALFRVSQLM